MDSAPQTIYPVLRYRDAQAAIEFLCRAFGFERNAVYESEDGAAVEHAQLALGEGMVMLSTEREDDQRGWGPHAGQGWIYVAVEDPDEHCERARAAGANIIRELENQDYGSRDYSAHDPEGNIWSFGTYNPALVAGSGAEAGS